jgi:nucleotide-binding universal stress UspA family protein
MKIQHILLPTDLSNEARRPLDAMLELAREQGARVTVLHVVRDLAVVPHEAPFAPKMSSPDLPQEVEAARVELEAWCASLGDGAERTLEVIGHEDPATGIVEYAREHDVDLIAISTHGRTGLRRLALGSVAESVLRKSEIPVLSFHRPGE